MVDSEAPPRLVSGNGVADFRLKRALREMQSHAPTERDRAELERRMAAFAAASAVGSSPTPAPAKRSLGSRLGALTWIKAAAAAALIAAGAAAYVTSTPPPATPTFTAAPRQPTAPPAVVTLAPPVSSNAAPSPSVTASGTAKPDRAAELRLLKAAQAALDASPARALSLTAEHAARYPRSSLAQERELLAVTALLRLGRTAEAQSRAERFQQRYPSSPYSHRIAAALPASKAKPSDSH